VVYQAFFSPPAAGDAQHHFHEAPLALLIPLCLTAAISVVIGICPDFFMHFAQAVLP
jgi:multicomponent Na+:H+ antiporter subunit D